MQDDEKGSRSVLCELTSLLPSFSSSFHSFCSLFLARHANMDIFTPLQSNGGRDVFVDIGDKSWGVTVCQKYFEKQAAATGHNKLQIRPENTLHVGDQFLSAGANDFRARSVGTTAWIASPEETVELLDELAGLMGKKMS